MNVFTSLYNYATKGSTRLNFHLFNFFTHLVILGITDNFTTKGILLAYASFIINFFCGEFIFFRINKVLEGLERLIYVNQNLEDLESESSDNSESLDNSESSNNSESSDNSEEESSDLEQELEELEAALNEDTESSNNSEETLKERIQSEVNF